MHKFEFKFKHSQSVLMQIVMKKWGASVLFATLLLQTFGCELAAKAASFPKDGVEGLVVNSTVSANGMSFFINFLDFWRDKQGSDKYTIEIAESVSKRLGNQVWVSFGQKRLFSSTLPIQRDRVRLISEQAAETCFTALITLSLPFSEEVDLDVADDEL